jgi:microsomal dipeptidase-like Zn-dependent dipeptidase
MFADLHCHPATAAYDENRKAAQAPDGSATDKEPFNPWHIPPSNLRRQAKGKRAFGYTQSDLAKSTQGNAQLLFASLYPTEKGFFFGINNGRTRQDILQLIRAVQAARSSGRVPQELSDLYESLSPAEKREFSKRTAIDELQARQMNYAIGRIQFIQSGSYDYFKELLHEYRFLQSFDAKPGHTPHALKLQEGGIEQVWSGAYRLAAPANVAALPAGTNRDVTFVLTIEGMHALGVGNYDWENVKDVSQAELLHRIRFLKGEVTLSDGTAWHHPPFFITFSHHFDNTLCGHAHSIPRLPSRLLFDQRKNQDEGLSENGFQAMKALLGLDDQLRPTGARRILIDIKHMSARGRRDFYNRITRPFNQNPANENNKIPIVASHVGYSGVTYLQAQIDHLNDETDNYNVDGFNAWNINLCAEDVREIHHSGGLIGLSFDQRILGLDRVFLAVNWRELLRGEKFKTRAVRQALVRTLAAIVRVPYESNLPEPERIWRTLCIGTDFDGFIDPLFNYPTVLSFRKFESDLVGILNELAAARPGWFQQISPAQAARAICYENARDFVIKHYP